MRKEKELLLNEIKDKIDGSTSILLTRYEKLAPNVSWGLRDQLAKTGSFLEVVRKQVFLKAAAKAGIPIDEALLKGHIGIVFVNQPDSLPSTKLLFKFAQDNEQMLEVIGGHIEGKMVKGSDLEILSKLPGMEEMRATLLGLFTSPMSQMLAVLEAVMAEPLSVISQKSE
jgi:large subunit ribosomal protein L10